MQNKDNNSYDDYEKYIKSTTILLSDIPVFYLRAKLMCKQKLIGSIYTESLIFDGNKYQTKRINEVFGLLLYVEKSFKIGQPNKNAWLSYFAPLIDERWSQNLLYEFITIRKLMN